MDLENVWTTWSPQKRAKNTFPINPQPCVCVRILGLFLLKGLRVDWLDIRQERLSFKLGVNENPVRIGITIAFAIYDDCSCVDVTILITLIRVESLLCSQPTLFCVVIY